ncbi:mature T-cell proliferation 1 neighbor protein-like protein [Rhizopus microsporus ATCC 52813]|uniref:Cx9C motif-containing protein 4, mitochondrial n=1 Tax=Rhizopus microsporus ATCC 52813 TaxID=1340429 RepID=A0A2G4T4Y8_RHIZD|nr:mature T-cell proliferation 1 neighbor protein-like protein [Rhizopus microsporus ATCC 52813]PHZ16069.1 mature T-cell proliferation 1 neighbor protein-like protein [Rhizopus microsporus ATCC 52813]
MSNQQKPPCQKYACDIQDCLAKNNYQESKCQDLIDKLDKCCQDLINNGGKSACCPEKKYKNNPRTK